MPSRPAPSKPPKPVLRLRGAGGDRRHVQRRAGHGEQALQQSAALAERGRGQVAVAEAEQVPRHQRRRRVLRQHRHPRRGRVNACLQGLELQSARARDDQLAVDHAAFRQLFKQRRGEFRKVAVHRLQVAALQQQVVTVAEHEGAEPVPLRFEQPAVAARDAVHPLGEHGPHRRRHRQRLQRRVGGTVIGHDDCHRTRHVRRRSAVE